MKTLEKTKVELKQIDGKPLTVDIVPYISAQKRAELNRIPIDFFNEKLTSFQEIADKVAQNTGKLKDNGNNTLEQIYEINAKNKELEASNDDYYLYIHALTDKLGSFNLDSNDNKDVASLARLQKSIVEEVCYDELNVAIVKAVIRYDKLNDKLKELIDSDFRSEFWQNQDFICLGETADYFREFIKPRR